MAKNLNIDASAETQSIDQPNRRTIYDADVTEIFVKSFIAGVGLGIGRMVATLIFFGIFLGIFVTYVQPWLMGVMSQLERTLPSFMIPISGTTTTQNSDSNRFQYNEDQILDLFNTFRSAPPETSEATETTTTQ